MKFDLLPDNKYSALGISKAANAGDCNISVRSSSHKWWSVSSSDHDISWKILRFV